MTVNIISWVPAYAGGESVTLIAPNISGSDIGTNFAGPDNILIGTGVGTFESVTMSDVLDGTFSTSGGPVGYSYNDLALPTASMDANNQLIINLLNPVNLQDAATKNYVDTAITGTGSFLPIAGGTMTGDIVFGSSSRSILNSGSALFPPIAFDVEEGTGMYLASTSAISFTNDLVGGNPTFTIESNGTLNVIGTTDYELLVTHDDDIPNKKYVDDAIITIGSGAFLELAGGIMTGDITFAGTQLFPYDNSTSGLAATELGAAVDEIDGILDSVTAATYVNTFNSRVGAVVAAASDYDAIQVDYDNTTSLMTAVNVQEAIDEIDATLDVVTGATYVNSFNTRLGDVVPAASDYDATQVDYDNGASGLTAITVQAAIDEIDTAVDAIVTDGPHLPLAGGTMTGGVDFLSAPTQLFPYVNSGTAIIGTDLQAATTELDGRVSDIETVINTGPFLELAGGTMTGNIDFGSGSLTAIGLADPTNPQDAATMNYVDTEISDLGLVGVGPYLALSGGTMTGSILGLTTLTVGDHILDTNDYHSGNGGNSFLITTSATPTAGAPTYSFASATTTGMYSNGAELRLAVGGTDRITMAAGVNGDVSMNSSNVTDVADPVNDQDAVTKKWITDMTTVRKLGSTFTFDLTAGAGTGANLIVVPTGKTHMYTQLVVRARSYNPGAGPTNPEISVGSTTSSGLNVLAQTELDWGGIAGSADQAIVIPLGQNSSPSATPNPGDTIQIKIQVPAGGTFVTLDVDVYLVGMEISS